MPHEEIPFLPLATGAFGMMGTTFEELYLPVQLLFFFSFLILLFLFPIPGATMM